MQVIAQPYIRIRIQAALEQQEILAALLGQAGCYAFEHQDQFLDAFVMQDDFDQATILDIISASGSSTAEITGIPHENWNAQWESSYTPVAVGQEWYIRAPFHVPASGYKHTITIQPKMAFGTGHHYTTRLMLSALSNLMVAGKDVLDMGCGSGVLGIAAAILGAKQITGIEIESWSCENARDNIVANNVQMTVVEGTAEQIGSATFDIILANIQRNVLTADAAIYAGALRPGGTLVVSGFFDFDEEHIRNVYIAEHLEPGFTDFENGWCISAFHKPDMP